LGDTDARGGARFPDRACDDGICGRRMKCCGGAPARSGQAMGCKRPFAAASTRNAGASILRSAAGTSFAATMQRRVARARTHIARRCGSSLTQCGLIHLTFTEAALRAQSTTLPCTLVKERTTQKRSSGLIASGDSQIARSSSSSRYESCGERHVGRSASTYGDRATATPCRSTFGAPGPFLRPPMAAGQPR
jgi:hypothetical protein